MKLIRKSSEDEMTAEFLKAEFTSERFGDSLRTALAHFKIRPRLITTPNLTSEKDNASRKSLFSQYRGYAKNKEIFEGFPDDISWHLALFTPPDLKRVKYIAYDYWIKLTAGSRLPADAAKNIKTGVVVFNQSNQRFFDVAEAIKKGAKLPRLIFVARDEKSTVVVLEGHVRLTAYMLVPAYIPPKLEVLIGYSPKLTSWELY